MNVLRDDVIELPHAKIHAGVGGWWIEFAFPGPDRRYKWTHDHLSPTKVRDLIDAYPAAFEHYAKLKSVSQVSSELTSTWGDFTLRAGGVLDGLWIMNIRYPIKTRVDLLQRLRTLERVERRGRELVDAVVSLST